MTYQERVIRETPPASPVEVVGWTILEWVVLWAVNLFRRETTVS